MPSVAYTARIALDTTVSPVHVAGEGYSLDFNLRSLVRTGEVQRNRRTSIGGTQETIHQHAVRYWDAETTSFPSTELEAWDEFLHSVADGTEFTFDPSGTAASPGADAETVTLDSDAWSITQVRGGSSPRYSVSFRVRRAVVT